MNSNGDSPVRGIKNVLSLKRGSRDDNSSIKSNDTRSPRRGSTDSAGSKLKAIITNLTNDDAELSDGRRSSKNLLGFGKLKDKASRRKSQAIESEEDLRGRDPNPKATESDTADEEVSKLSNSEDASLISESDVERTDVKPPLINHPSHVGYLTSSSPQIKATTLAEDSFASDSPTTAGGTRFKKLLGKTLSMPVTGRNPSPSPTRPGTRGDSDISSLSLRPQKSSPDKSRSISPATKPETIASRRLSRGAETAALPSLQLARGLGNKSKDSNDSVPSIVTIPDTPPLGSEMSPSSRPATSKEDFSHRPLAAKSLASHRRIRSDGPPTSKLSQSMAPPLTPLEEAKTPAGSRHASGASVGGGFFSSVFNVAQNAANTLTNTLQTTARPKTSNSDRSIEKLALDEEESVDDESPDKTKPLAIETLGEGDLGLHHLGITIDPPASDSPTPSLRQNGGRSRSDTVIHNEPPFSDGNTSPGRTVSAAYSVADSGVPAITPTVEDVSPVRPASLVETPIVPVIEEKTTPIAAVIAEEKLLPRSGSIRSKIERTRNKRHRNSSGATIAAGIASTHGAFAMNGANKFASFTKANAKRNKDFHGYFRSVPDDDELIEDYSCALQRDIILAGRIYISEGHVCFSSNIMGWVTNLVISFDEIVSVEKESTAMLFANAIAIQTLQARHTFRSLLSRDATYDLIINIWRLNHPGLESSENGLRLASGTGSKTTRVLNGSQHGSEGSINSGSYEDSDSEDSENFEDSIEPSVNGEEIITRKVSAAGYGNTQASTSAAGTLSEKLANSVASLGDYPGPAQHAPTDYNDIASRYENILKDDVVPVPLGKVYSLVFGPASANFMSRWLQDEEKATDVQMEERRGLSENRQTRTFSYIKPLYNPLGPKCTKCIVTEHLDLLDLERAVVISVSTQTPDVPSGNIFVTKTRYCLTWGPNNSTRMVMTYVIEWSGKTWLKSTIEAGATGGQKDYANNLVKALKIGATPRGRTTTQGSRNKKKRRKSAGSSVKTVEQRTANWGPLQPIYDTYASIIRPLKPLFSLYSVISILLFLLVINYFGPARNRYSQPQFRQGVRSTSYTTGTAAWEDMWLSEEEALWEWLQDRTGLSEGLAFPVRAADDKRSEELNTGGGWFGRSKKRTAGNRDIHEAIKLTEERLASLKQKVGKPASSQQKSDKTPQKQDKVQLSDEEAAGIEQLLNGVVGA